MPIQVCVDESGGKGNSNWFCGVGLVAESEAWAVFSDEWDAALKEDRKIHGAFKMKQVANWPAHQAEAKLRRLVDILVKHVDFICYTVIDLNAHSRMWEEILPKEVSNHYFLCFIDTITTVATHLDAMGCSEKFEAIFDTQDVYGPRAHKWYPHYREIVKNRWENGIFRILPTEPIYRADEEFLPLQGADMIAWCLRDFMENEGSSRYDWIIKSFADKAIDFNGVSDKEFKHRLSRNQRFLFP